MPYSTRHLVAFLPALVALLSIGCSGSEFGATVSGKVTLDGNPVVQGVVTFAPDDPKGPSAVGNLKSNGDYYLKTKKTLGIIPGKYRVAVQAYERPEGLAPGERVYGRVKPLVPKKYLNVVSTDLEFEVQPGSNTIDIPLTSN